MVIFVILWKVIFVTSRVQKRSWLEALGRFFFPMRKTLKNNAFQGLSRIRKIWLHNQRLAPTLVLDSTFIGVVGFSRFLKQASFLSPALGCPAGFVIITSEIVSWFITYIYGTSKNLLIRYLYIGVPNPFSKYHGHPSTKKKSIHPNEVVASWRKTVGGWTKLLCFFPWMFGLSQRRVDLSLPKSTEYWKIMVGRRSFPFEMAFFSGDILIFQGCV